MSSSYLERRSKRMDRVDKALLVLPVLPLFDLVSTLFSLSLGGAEVGFLARPILQQYGPVGLVFLAVSASLVFLAFMGVVIYIKRLYVAEWRFKWMWYMLIIPVYWFFVLQAFYVSTVVTNLLVPLAPFLTQTILIRALPALAYFIGVTALTKQQIKQLPHI
jgi:hypothetical protein